ncbi:MAG: hypothetical protein EBS86_15840 [Crocinitomicaceae bacterium]|nr:hypothetical protein [Crocinitomicaceae bacterium]
MPLYVITTIATSINRYAIEADSSECAIKEWNSLDEGRYDDYVGCCEIFQIDGGEDICRVDEVTQDELIAQADVHRKEKVFELVRKAPYQDRRGFME